MLLNAAKSSDQLLHGDVAGGRQLRVPARLDPDRACIWHRSPHPNVGQPSGQVTGITTANGKTCRAVSDLVAQVSCNAQGLLFHTSWSSTFTFTKAAGGVGTAWQRNINLGNANLNKKISWTFKRHFNKLPQ